MFFYKGLLSLTSSGLLRRVTFSCDEKVTKESPRAFPPRYPPGVPGWNCVKSLFRPVTLAVAPATATIPGHPGQLALWLGVFHSRASPGETAVSSRRWPGSRQRCCLVYTASKAPLCKGGWLPVRADWGIAWNRGTKKENKPGGGNPSDPATPGHLPLHKGGV